MTLWRIGMTWWQSSCVRPTRKVDPFWQVDKKCWVASWMRTESDAFFADFESKSRSFAIFASRLWCQRHMLNVVVVVMLFFYIYIPFSRYPLCVRRLTGWDWMLASDTVSRIRPIGLIELVVFCHNLWWHISTPFCLVYDFLAHFITELVFYCQVLIVIFPYLGIWYGSPLGPRIGWQFLRYT